MIALFSSVLPGARIMAVVTGKRSRTLHYITLHVRERLVRKSEPIFYFQDGGSRHLSGYLILMLLTLFL